MIRLGIPTPSPTPSAMRSDLLKSPSSVPASALAVARGAVEDVDVKAVVTGAAPAAASPLPVRTTEFGGLVEAAFWDDVVVDCSVIEAAVVVVGEDEVCATLAVEQ